jgi:hypothetical protein
MLFESCKRRLVQKILEFNPSSGTGRFQGRYLCCLWPPTMSGNQNMGFVLLLSIHTKIQMMCRDINRPIPCQAQKIEIPSLKRVWELPACLRFGPWRNMRIKLCIYQFHFSDILFKRCPTVWVRMMMDQLAVSSPPICCGAWYMEWW